MTTGATDGHVVHATARTIQQAQPQGNAAMSTEGGDGPTTGRGTDIPSLQTHSSLRTPAPPQNAMEMNAGFFDTFRELQLLTEFKRLTNKAPNGVYAMPSLASMQVWSGVIFIHEGLYQDGIFKFCLTVPDEYPSVAPRLRFLSNVYHPLVGTSGEFDVAQFFNPWVAGKHHISDALVLMKRIFYHLDKVDRAYVKNRLAYELYNTDVSIFKASVKACVAESIDNKYDNFPNESVFTFQPWDQHVHPKALKAINGGMGDREGGGAEEDGIYSWVTSSIGSVTDWFNPK